MTTPNLAAYFDRILDRLLVATSASRTTLRLDDEKLGLHVDDVAGESLREGVKSLRGQTAMNQRELTTVQWLERERRNLIQPDFSATDVPPPAALREIYGVKAQMLGPVIVDGRLKGWVSAHFCEGPRIWSDEDVSHLDQAVSDVLLLLNK